jgi:hypothetical protein
MDNLDDFLGSNEPQAEEAVVETPAEEAPVAEEAAPEEAAEPAPAVERDEKGRFKPKEAPVMVPLTALHETRDEVKALKAELERPIRPRVRSS